MAEVVKGADVKAKLIEAMKAKIAETGITPCLGILRVGAKDSDLSYEKGVKKTCADVGIEVKVFELAEDVTQEQLEAHFKCMNESPDINGILMFRPLPKGLDEKPLIDMIDPEKDMDCMSPINFAKLSMGDDSGYSPCTAEAVIKICDYIGVDYAGANAVVIGRSTVIGRPVGYMLLSRSASVSFVHSKTKDPYKKCEGADILVCATGKAGLVTEDYVKNVNPGCVAIDVGINFVDGKMCGDFAFDEVEKHVAKITPVPGGVGAVTNTIMASHVVRAAIKQKTGEVFNF